MVRRLVLLVLLAACCVVSLVDAVNPIRHVMHRSLQTAGTHQMTATEEAAGGEFAVNFGFFNLTVAAIQQSNCSLQDNIFAVCVRSECSNFEDVCPSFVVVGESAAPSTKQEASAEIDDCSTIDETICGKHGQDDGCCVNACALELRVLALCVGEIDNTVGQENERCSVLPVCHSRVSSSNTTTRVPTSAAPVTRNPILQPTASPTFIPSLVPSSTADNLEPTDLSSILAPTAEPAKDSTIQEPSQSLNIIQPATVAFTIFPSSQPSSVETTQIPVAANITTNTSSPLDQNITSPTAAHPPSYTSGPLDQNTTSPTVTSTATQSLSAGKATQPPSSAPSAEPPKSKFYKSNGFVTLMAPIGATCLLLLLLYTSKQSGGNGLESRKARNAVSDQDPSTRSRLIV